MLRRTFIGAAALAIAGAIDAASFATITLSPVFTDHAVLQRDLPLLQGTILVLAMFFVVLNLLVVVAQTWLDPRIKRA